MNMDHVNLSVPDIQETRAFLETYFGLRFLGPPDTNKIIVAVDDNKTIVALSNFSNASHYDYPDAFHIGFNQPSREAVDAIHQKMIDNGIKAGKRIDFHGAWTFYVKPLVALRWKYSTVTCLLCSSRQLNSLTLQLHSIFEVSASYGGLVCASPT